MGKNSSEFTEWARQLRIFIGTVDERVLWLFLFICSWFLMFLISGPMIHWLRQKRWKKDVVTDAEAWQVREDTPETHQKKQGTPSMGGIGIISVAVGTFGAWVLADLCLDNIAAGISILNSAVAVNLMMWCLLPLIVAAHAGLGFADDWSKASGRGGLRARSKFLGQVILAIGFYCSSWFSRAICLRTNTGFLNHGAGNLG